MLDTPLFREEEEERNAEKPVEEANRAVLTGSNQCAAGSWGLGWDLVTGTGKGVSPACRHTVQQSPAD